MEVQSRKLGFCSCVFIAMALLIIPHFGVSATIWNVGGGQGWTPGVNYTDWAEDIKFYKGDWLVFVYEKNQNSVLQVRKKDFELCNSDNPIHNWTDGRGKDDVQLKSADNYYFINGEEGLCVGGMKLSVQVLKSRPPPPPTI